MPKINFIACKCVHRAHACMALVTFTSIIKTHAGQVHVVKPQEGAHTFNIWLTSRLPFFHFIKLIINYGQTKIDYLYNRSISKKYEAISERVKKSATNEKVFSNF